MKGALIIKSNKKIKIIFFDLDDTLLNSEECISNNTKEAIKECSNKGILIGYITARAPRKTGKFLEGLPCDCIAYYNGAIIKAKDELIGSYGINYYEGLELIRSSRKDMPDTYSIHGSVVISNSSACKKNAVNKIIDHFHIEKTEVLSFGDDINDIGMIEASGTGVAMANAVQELKDIADYVTLSNDEEGIAVYLNKFIL